MPTLSAAALTTFASQLFEANGVPQSDAAIVATSLVDANLSGHDSHGVIRVMQYLKSIQDCFLHPGASFSVTRESPSVIVADGGWGFGQVQAHRLLERIATKARQTGLCAGTLFQCGHIGRLGEYAERAAALGLAFMGTVNNHGYGRTVAPPGGKEGRIGTNPLCLGVPTHGDPVFLDIGTSVCAEGKVRVCYNKGVPVPAGWLLDAEGRPTTNPNVLYQEPRGTILPLGGEQAYKGFGIGLLLDMFTGGLSGGPCSAPGRPSLGANAVFFLVLDLEHFAGSAHFLSEVSQLTHNVRSCPQAEGATEILAPGDPERRARAQRKANGIPLDEGTWSQLTALATKLNVPIPPAS